MHKLGVSLIMAFLVGLPGCATVGGSKPANYDEPIRVTMKEIQKVNSANGVTIDIGFENTSDKTFKYVRFHVRSYNRVGDPEPSEIDGESLKTARSTGPYKPGQTTNEFFLSDTVWKNLWYGPGITCFRIEGVEITTMDGETIRYGEGDVEAVLASSVNNTC